MGCFWSLVSFGSSRSFRSKHQKTHRGTLSTTYSFRSFWYFGSFYRRVEDTKDLQDTIDEKSSILLGCFWSIGSSVSFRSFRSKPQKTHRGTFSTSLLGLFGLLGLLGLFIGVLKTQKTYKTQETQKVQIFWDVSSL